jgi:hypothetical protein
MIKPLLSLFVVASLLPASAQVTLFSDDMESYSPGIGVAAQSSVWNTWTGSPSEDAIVSTLFANSGFNSVRIQGTTVDLVLPVGPYNSGKYDMKWKMYLPSNSTGGYFNALHQWSTSSSTYVWAIDVFFTTQGMVNVVSGAVETNGVAIFPVGQWFDVQVTADMGADQGKLYIQNELAHQWQWSLSNADGSPGFNTLAAIDFYGTNQNLGNGLYFIDDVQIIQSTGVNVSEEPVRAELNWYPNPADDVVTVELPLWSIGGQVMLMDLMGRVLSNEFVSGENMIRRMDVSDLTTGIYLIKVVQGAQVYTGKVTVRR